MQALEIKKDHAGALLGLALVAAQNFDHRAADLARKALESDPSLLKPRELLARLARARRQRQPKGGGSPGGPGDECEFSAGQGHSGDDGLAGRQEDTAWDPRSPGL